MIGDSKLTKITDGAVHFDANWSDKLRFADSNDFDLELMILPLNFCIIMKVKDHLILW